ncbi:class I SAM-dependent methyltransferase, partial [Candidatus Dojkabacteria bacterium]|nr:class I SAM-dependent methyltransferase [Candidatus Dojkabacteria bacterium]
MTDRKTEAIFEILGLTYDDFRPEDTVFVAGSGLRQKFERDIAPRVSEVFACDPSLAVGSGWRVWFNNSDPDGLNAVTYVETDDREDLITAEEFALLRKVDMPNNLHIITDKIPPIKMPDDSVDKGFDVIGASNYMPVEDLEEYYREIFRVLRPGGEFRL